MRLLGSGRAPFSLSAPSPVVRTLCSTRFCVPLPVLRSHDPLCDAGPPPSNPGSSRPAVRCAQGRGRVHLDPSGLPAGRLMKVRPSSMARGLSDRAPGGHRHLRTASLPPPPGWPTRLRSPRLPGSAGAVQPARAALHSPHPQRCSGSPPHPATLSWGQPMAAEGSGIRACFHLPLQQRPRPSLPTCATRPPPRAPPVSSPCPGPLTQTKAEPSSSASVSAVTSRP